MPIKKLKYDNLGSLIKKNLSNDEDFETKASMKILKPAQKRGWLTKKDLIAICKWKSSRAIRLIELNTEREIKKITALAFKTRNEETKIKILTELKGVAIPMASAILMLINPKRYGVIDIRVWEVLLETGTVNTNPKGINFRFNEWIQYLNILRHFAIKYNTSVRNIERSLFIVHKSNQEGNLYGNLIKTIKTEANKKGTQKYKSYSKKAILKIVIKAEWFEMILAKRKPIEYRDVTQFWISRLYDSTGKKRNYDLIEFINGYNTNARRLITKYEGFNKKGNKFHIIIGKIISK